MLTIILCSVFAFLLIVYLVLCVIFSRIVDKLFFYPHLKTREQRILENIKCGYYTESGDGLKRESITFTLSDNYVIHGDIIKNDPHKYIILVHGHASNREGVIKYAKVFNELGYSLIIYDHRGCGDNEKEMVCMGYKEHRDLIEIISFVKQDKNIKQLGLFGVSMGGACCLMSSIHHQDLDFIITDCPFSSMKSQAINTYHYVHLPAWPFLWFTNLYFHIKHKFGFKQVRPYVSVRNNKVPLLLFHGSKDRIVNFSNAKKIIDNNLGYKEFHPFVGADHGKSLDTDRDRYISIVIDFLKKVSQ